MAPNPRIAKAFRAMRDIGIPEEKTKPALKCLLITYEKNWEPIEKDNYRALAVAIFDSEKTKAAELKKILDNVEVEAGNTVPFKEPTVNRACASINPKEEPNTDDTPTLEVPISVTRPAGQKVHRPLIMSDSPRSFFYSDGQGGFNFAELPLCLGNIQDVVPTDNPPLVHYEAFNRKCQEVFDLRQMLWRVYLHGINGLEDGAQGSNRKRARGS